MRLAQARERSPASEVGTPAGTRAEVVRLPGARRLQEKLIEAMAALLGYASAVLESLSKSFLALMLRVRQNSKVLRAVVVFDAVLVMNKFSRQKQATKNAFHDQAMFKDVAVQRRIRVLESLDLDIALFSSNAAPLPSAVLFEWRRDLAPMFLAKVTPAVLVTCHKARWPLPAEGRWGHVRVPHDCPATTPARRFINLHGGLPSHV